MQSGGQQYGQALPDQIYRIGEFFDAHLELISDVRELYRDRAALEREYAGKLHALAKKAAEKKAKAKGFIVGEEPTKTWDENVLSRSTLGTAYSEITASIAHTAQDHVNIAEALTTQVVDVLKTVERKNEESKKKVLQFFQKILSDRDRVYGDRAKSKQKYDEECAEVETYRQKQNRAHDDRHADRAAKQAEQQRVDMLNSKNVYLISIAIANNTKTKFYNEDLPGLENELQELQTHTVGKLSKILLHSQALQLGHLDTLKGRLTVVEKALGDIDPSKDQNLFIEYNLRTFVPPSEWQFEPCVSHYDTEEMSVESTPKVFLQNKLSRCRTKLKELSPLLESKRKESDQLSKLVSAYAADRSLGNLDDISDNYLETKHQLISYSTSECILKAEVDVIVSALGDDEGAQHPHSFKSSSFSIPTQCGYCQNSIWGLSKQGKTCKACGLSVHSKCELKIPADCRVSDGHRQAEISPRPSQVARNIPRPDSISPSSSTPSSFVASSTNESYEESYPTARLLFDFEPTSEFELAVPEGAVVQVMEPDDGSGWVKVVDTSGKSGLVPASYVEYSDSTAPVAPPNAQARLQGSGIYVRSIYSYESQGPDELGLKEGELIELSAGPTGGKNYADGWWEGLDSKGKKGIFPSNYVELV